MKKIIFLAFAVTVSIISKAQDIDYGNCPGCWNPDSLGNHRVLLQVNDNNRLAHVRIAWRRRDENPALKKMILVDAATNRIIKRIWPESINREYADLYFEAVSGPGLYYLYYMPYKNEGRSNYPKGVYLAADTTADAAWIKALPASMDYNTQVKQIQTIDAFNSYFPMEVIATRQETAGIINSHAGQAFLVFPEDRNHSIRMRHDLPYRWIKKGPQNNFRDTAARGEYFSYQLGIWALKDMENVQVHFSDLVSEKGKHIVAANSSCLPTEGIDYTGKPMNRVLNISKDKVQAVWCLLHVPENTVPGLYKGTATIHAQGIAPVAVQLAIRVTNTVLKDGGIDKPAQMTRLHWLNSTMAQKNDVIAPYTPLRVHGRTIELLGRSLTLGADGMPSAIKTYFTPEMTAYTKQANEILSAPLRWKISDDKGRSLALKASSVQFTKRDPGTVTWTAISRGSALAMEVKGSLEFDGFLAYTVKIEALKDIELNDIALEMPFSSQSATYMMGLGRKGGYRPHQFNWKWDVAHKNQDGAWIGSVNAGLQFSLRDENYVRPLNTNFYLKKPLLLPTSWGNEGRGGIDISEDGKTVSVNNYSGHRKMRKGDVLYYNFNLLITPFHTLQTDFQWRTRFFHKYDNVDSIKATGATVVNIHHATPINPWINYPFIEYRKMKDYIDSAHALGLKVKIYNTIRELSNHAYETFALRSLGHEIYSPGMGGGYSWLQEHLDSDYIAAWFVPAIKDAAIINSGMNRWHNYYVEGMNWLVNHVGIDGIYLDDVAFDRVTMKRIKRVLTQNGHPGIIDLHSANQYNPNDGYNNSANLYMEHFPYLNRLWFGEYFDYENNDPDFFLTEVSGIPFGLMGEMLQGGGNPWRGMIYGMTNRMPWSDNADPRPIWKLWDAFGMQGSQMIGYWSGHCPVTTDHPKVLATVYKRKKEALVSIASWADTDTNVKLTINWKELGIDPAKAVVVAPAVNSFQPALQYHLQDPLPVAKGKGWLLWIREK